MTACPSGDRTSPLPACGTSRGRRRGRWNTDAAFAAGDSTPSTITASSPIEPPINPCWPGNAGVAPLRIDEHLLAAVLFPPREVVVVVHALPSPRSEECVNTRSTTQSRPAYAYSPAMFMAAR